MEKLKGKKRDYFAIKVDLSKAYDKLNWEFIWRTLQEIKLLERMINLIMHTMSSVEINVNWNGVRNRFFYPQHGTHQGDLISPYLFVLCMDKLSHLIEQEVRSKNWKVINLGRQRAMILHLMFADGLLLLGESTEKQMKCVIDTLNLFCSMPGQEVSHEKTNMLFSKNIARSMQMKLSQLSCFRVTSSFGKYLGVPFSGKKLRRD